MSNDPNTLFRLFPTSDVDGPMELEGTSFNNIEDQHQAFADTGSHEVIVTRKQLEDGQELLKGEFPEDTVFGIDIDSGSVLVNLGQFPDKPADEVYLDRSHQVTFSFGLEEARRIYGAE